MLVAHCSHDYGNRRQRLLLRTSPRFFTACHLIPTGPSWCSVETGHASTGTALNNQMSLCGKTNGVGSLHCALKQHLCCMVLSVLSQELSERKRLDFKLLAESDQTQQPSGPVRCFEEDSVLSKLYLWQILSSRRGLKANMQHLWLQQKNSAFWKIWLGLVRREAGRDRLNYSCYFSNPTFLWRQTLHLAALNVHIVQVMGESYVGLRQFYHFIVNSYFFYKSWKIINRIKIQYFNTASTLNYRPKWRE